jgi:CheY-like chemotaxis protein
MANARKILVVDDDAELREALVEQLALHEEFETSAVETAQAAFAEAKDGHVDLVLMDVGLPDMDGRDAVRVLRKNGFKAPVIMLTGHGTDSDTIWDSRRARTIMCRSRSGLPSCLPAFARSCGATRRAKMRSSRSGLTVFVPAEKSW